MVCHATRPGISVMAFMTVTITPTKPTVPIVKWNAMSMNFTAKQITTACQICIVVMATLIVQTAQMSTTVSSLFNSKYKLLLFRAVAANLLSK